MFTLFNFIVSLLLVFIGRMLFGLSTSADVLVGMYTLAVLLPSFGVSVRRLHDIGKSGWWLLLAFVPFVGGIILLVFMCLDSQPGANQYGPNPKETATAAPSMAMS